MTIAMISSVNYEWIIPIVVALIMGGPAWRFAKSNKADHGVVQGLIKDVVIGQARTEVWQTGHDIVHAKLLDRIEHIDEKVSSGNNIV